MTPRHPVKPGYAVILASMRTGSNLLEEVLRHLPGTRCLGELFNPAFIGNWGREEFHGWTRARRDQRPEQFLSATVARAHADGLLPVFRLFDGHAPAVLAYVLADPACAKIILRRDPLESWISLQIAKKTGQWLLREAKGRRRARATFDGEAFAVYRAGLTGHYGRLEAALSAGDSVLRLEYRELGALDLPQRLVHHLGLDRPSEPVAPGLIRQNPGSPGEKVINPGEMFAWLAAEPGAGADAAGIAAAPEDLVLARGAALAHAPLPGGADALAWGLMAGLVCNKRDLPAPAALPRVHSHPGPNALLARGHDAQALARLLPRRAVFAVVRHPLARAWSLLRARGGDADDFPAWLADGADGVPSQVAHLAAWRGIARIGHVFRAEEPFEMAKVLARRLTLPKPTRAGVEQLAALTGDAPPETVSTRAVQQALLRLWPEDFRVFRYDADPTAPQAPVRSADRSRRHPVPFG